jgi:hypothetical protein
MTSALDITEAVKPPRSVFVNFPLGHQTGKPHQPELQRSILRDAFHALETIATPGTIVTLPYAFHALETIATPGTIVTLPYAWDDKGDGWEDLEYRPGYLLPYSRTGAGVT